MKRLVSALLALTMIFSLSACGKKDTPKVEYHTEYVVYEWPVCDCAAILPVPKSNLGHVRVANETRLVMDISDTSAEEVLAYAKLCADQGFDDVYVQGDDRYYAHNADGWYLRLDSEEDGTAMLIDLRAPELEEEAPTEEPSDDEPLDISTEPSSPPEPSQEPEETPEPSQEPAQPSEPAETEPPVEEPNAVYYSTNSAEKAKNGNSGVFAYRHDDKNYDTYWIIDFGEGFAYTFTLGNGSETCDKIEITSGDLNEYVVVTYHDGSDSWEEGLRFKRKRQPTTMVWMDGYGGEVEYTATTLKDALEIRDGRTIIDY